MPQQRNRIPLSEMTQEKLDALYTERDQYAGALHRVKERAAQTRTLQLLGVRRYGEPDTTPIAIEGSASCGLFSDHVRNECIGLSHTDLRGAYGLIHLTTEDALRLSDLLRAMAGTEDTTPSLVPVPVETFDQLVRVAMWVSRGRSMAFTPDPDPRLGSVYPDATARHALGALDDAGLLQQFRTSP